MGKDPRGGVGGGYSTEFYKGRLHLKFQTLTLLYSIFNRKGNPFMVIYLHKKIVPLSYTYSANTASLFVGSVQDIGKAPLNS